MGKGWIAGIIVLILCAGAIGALFYIGETKPVPQRDIEKVVRHDALQR